MGWTLIVKLNSNSLTVVTQVNFQISKICRCEDYQPLNKWYYVILKIIVIACNKNALHLLEGVSYLCCHSCPVRCGSHTISTVSPAPNTITPKHSQAMWVNCHWGSWLEGKQVYLLWHCCPNMFARLSTKLKKALISWLS